MKGDGCIHPYMKLSLMDELERYGIGSGRRTVDRAARSLCTTGIPKVLISGHLVPSYGRGSCPDG